LKKVWRIAVDVDWEHKKLSNFVVENSNEKVDEFDNNPSVVPLSKRYLEKVFFGDVMHHNPHGFTIDFESLSPNKAVFFITEPGKEGVKALVDKIGSVPLYESIFNASKEAIILCDFYNGIILKFNEPARKLFLAPKLDSFIGIPSTRVELHAKSFEDTANDVEQVLLGKKLFREVHYQKMSGETFWGRTYISKLEIEGRAYLLFTIEDIEEERAIRKRLKRQESLYKLFAENSADLLSLHDQNGHLIYVNPMVERILGFTPEDLSGENIFKYVEPVHKKALIVEAIEAFSKRRPLTIEFRMLDKFGDWVWVESVIKPIEDPVFEDAKFMAITRNIDFQKKNQLKLVESSQQLESITSNLQEGVYRSTLNDGIIFCNKAFLAMFGFESLAELKDFGSQSLYVNQGERDLLTNKLLKSKSYLNERVQFRRKDGSTFYAINNCRVDFDSMGNMVFDGAITDLTEIFVQEQKIRESEERYRLLAENATDVIVMYNENMEMSYISPSCINMFGYSQVEIKDAPYLGLVHPDDKPWVGKLIKRLIDDKVEQYEYTYRINTKSKGYIWIEVNSKRNFDKNGKLLNSILNVRDVTEKIKTQNQLREAKVRAEKALKAESEFLSVMSHEIKTPLNAIVGMTNLLNSKNSGLNTQEIVETLAQSSKHLMHLVSDLLDFKKISSGNIEIEEISFNPMEIFRQAKKLYESTAAEKNNKLILKAVSTLPSEIMGDPTRLSQIINNLLSNALKFTENGEVTVSIDYKVEDKKRYLNFKVVDTGIGIEKGKIKSIFEAFKQENPEISRLYGGTGLGLTIVKSIISQMGGKIEVNSEKNKGTCFDISIPVKEPLGEKGKRKRDFKDSILPANLKVYCVDDVELNLLLVNGYCHTWGVNIATESNPVAALNHLSENEYDLIFLDLQMPEIDGYEIAQKLRQNPNPKIATTPIFAITAKTQDELKNLESFGFNGFLLKPLNPERLHKVLSDFCELHESESIEKEQITEDLTQKESEEQLIPNLDTLRYLFDSNDEFNHFINLTVQEIENTVSSIDKNNLENNFEVLSAELHKLKGFISHFGLSQIIEEINALRNSLKMNGLTPQNSKMISALGEKLKSVSEYLSKIPLQAE
jgi:PAS domain S-box-containing protein